MRRLLTPLATVALLSLSVPALADVPAALRAFAVSQDHHTPNEASFTSKAAIVKFTGRTSQVTGTGLVNPLDVAKTTGKVSVDLASLDTGIAMRNDHMRHALETDKFPSAVFTLKTLQVPGNQLKANAPVTGTVTGTMAIHGVTRPVSAPIEVTYLPETDAQYRPGDWVELATTFKLKVSDYGIALPKPVLGVKIADEMTIDFTSMAKAQ